MVNNKSLGKKLRSLRTQNGLSVKKLYTILDSLNLPICTQSIYKWEIGLAAPDLKTLNALANIYNISIGSFFDEDGKVQALTPDEQRLIEQLHSSRVFKRIIFLLVKLSKGGKIYGD